MKATEEETSHTVNPVEKLTVDERDENKTTAIRGGAMYDCCWACLAYLMAERTTEYNKEVNNGVRELDVLCLWLTRCHRHACHRRVNNGGESKYLTPVYKTSQDQDFCQHFERGKEGVDKADRKKTQQISISSAFITFGLTRIETNLLLCEARMLHFLL